MNDLIVKGKRYHRPNGRVEEGEFTIPGALSDTRLAQLELLKDNDLVFTVEFIPGGMINLCLEDGQFDYKFELTPNGPELTDKILEILDGFDLEDYRKAAHDNETMDKEGSL